MCGGGGVGYPDNPLDVSMDDIICERYMFHLGGNIKMDGSWEGTIGPRAACD